MEVKKEALVERVQESYRQLSVAATTLNSASDKLGASITALDVGLKKLNLGISAWVHFSEWHYEDGFRYQYDDIGYAKIGGKWGLAIRTIAGNEADGDQDSEQWPFNESPRGFRVRAVMKIPDLFETLIKEAGEIAKTVNQRSDEVDLLTEAINAIADQTAQEAKQHGKTQR